MQAEAGRADWRAWLTVAVLLLAYTFSFIDRSILSLLVVPIRRDLGLSDTQFSLLHGLAFAIFYTGLGLPIARLADRSSRRVIMAAGIFVWSLATAACGLARGFAQLFGARILVGVGEAALSPAAYSMIADLFPRRLLGRALGVYNTGVFLGAGLALIIGGAVVAAVADATVALPVVGSVAGWQVTFLVVGLPGVLIAALVLLLREPDRRDGDQAQPPVREVLAFLWRHRGAFAAHFFGFSAVALFYNALFAWSPALLIRRFGLGGGEAGLYLGVITLVFGTAGIYAGGWLADALAGRGRSDAVLRTGLLACAGIVPLAVAAPLAPGLGWTLAAYCPLMFFVSMPWAAAAAGLQLVSPARMRAQVSALYLFVINLAGIGLGPTVAALLTDRVFGADAALPWSLALVGVAGPALGAALLAAGRPAYRRCYDAVSGAG